MAYLYVGLPVCLRALVRKLSSEGNILLCLGLSLALLQLALVGQCVRCSASLASL